LPKIGYTMMDIDLLSDRSLYDAIYGHARVSPESLQELVRDWPIAFPCVVIAIQHGGRPAPVRPAGVSLFVHPGLIYWLVPEPQAPLDGVLMGEPQPCPAPDDLVDSIQHAIISMRRQELLALGDRPATPPSPETDRQLVALAVAQLRAAHPAGGDTLELWLKVAHALYNRSLNLLRRRLIEFLSTLTDDSAEVPGYSQAYELAVRHVYGTFVISELLAGFAAHVMAVAGLCRSSLATRVDPGSGGLVERAQAYIAATYRQPIQLQHVAQAVGVTAPHLARQFRAATGQTIGQALMDLRLREARILLIDTDWPIRAVAADCGFGSQEHFHRSFKRELGMPPGAYRAAR